MKYRVEWHYYMIELKDPEALPFMRWYLLDYLRKLHRTAVLIEMVQRSVGDPPGALRWFASRGMLDVKARR